MNVLFDITALMVPKLTGVGVYERELLLGLNKAIGSEITPIYRFSKFPKKRFLSQNIPTHVARTCTMLNPLRDRIAGPTQIFHGPDCKVIAQGHQKMIVTIHDLQPFFSEWWTSPERPAAMCADLRALLARKLAHIIVPSQSVADDIEAFFPELNTPISVIHHGCEHVVNSLNNVRDNYATQRPEIASLANRRFVFCLGTIELRKNQGRLIEAFAKLDPKRWKHVSLVLAGGPGHGADALFQRHGQVIAALKSAQRLSILGNISDSEKHWLLENCSAFAYPSLYEGFGLPLIEAMTFNKPILTSNFGAMSEVVGPQGVLVNSRDTSEIEQGLERILSATTNSVDWSQRMRSFTWENSVLKHIEIYRSV